MRLVCMGVAGAALLAGCSQKPVVEECFDEFVQEFEIRIPGWNQLTAMCKAEAQKLPSPDAYHFMTSRIRVEYSQGDYYLEQVDSFYKLEAGTPGEGDERHCQVAVPNEWVITQRFEEGELETNVLDNDQPMVPVAMYVDALQFGQKRLVNPRWQDSAIEDAEDTDFKLRCASTERKSTAYTKTPACMPVEPVKSCDAVRQMLPIHQEGETRFGRVIGKTTKLEMGKVGSLVDKSTWVMESDEAE